MDCQTYTLVQADRGTMETQTCIGLSSIEFGEGGRSKSSSRGLVGTTSIVHYAILGYIMCPTKCRQTRLSGWPWSVLYSFVNFVMTENATDHLLRTTRIAQVKESNLFCC